MTSATFRDAVPADVPVLLDLVAELAAFERLADEAVATARDLHESLFGPVPRAYAMLAEHDGAVAGMAIFFFSFSTFTGRPSLYLEDVFVRPAHRGQGIGRAFFRRLAQRAVAERCGRMEWSVLDWNQPALDFYHALGAQPRADWSTLRLVGPAIASVADGRAGFRPDPPEA